MDPEQAIFTALKAMYTADSGSGGLSASSGNARVGSFLRRGHMERNPPGPSKIEVEVVWRDISPMGDPGSSGAQPTGVVAVDAVVRMHLITHRNLAFVHEDVVLSRMVRVYWRRTPGSVADGSWSWTFSRLSRAGSTRGPSSDTEVHAVQSYRLVGTYTAT